jgi:hypothetical protein
MAKKLAAFSTVANNAVTNYKRGDLEYQIKEQEDAIEKEKARKAKFDADIAAEKAKQEMQKTIREAEDRQREKEKEDKRRKATQEGSDYTQSNYEEASGTKIDRGPQVTIGKGQGKTRTVSPRSREAMYSRPTPLRAQKQTTVSRSGPRGKFKG